MKRKLQVLVGIVVVGAVLEGVALAASSPSVVTGGTSSVGDTSALLHGTVNPNGSATSYFFQWGLTTAYGTNGAVRPAGSGTTAKSVAETAGHLSPGTVYHYRLVAMNHVGTSVGADHTFKTAGHPAPAVTTGPVTQLSASGATLTGAVDPNGQSTIWSFQWGNLGGLSQQTAPQTLGPTTSPQGVAWSLGGLLNAGTVYQYRLVANHPHFGKVYGAIEQFMTYPSVRPYSHVRTSTRPIHASSRPFVLSTTGTVETAWIPAQFGCTGEVTIRMYVGRRQVLFRTARVQSNCTFSHQTTFNRVPGGRGAHLPERLRIVVHFVSTPYLARNPGATRYVRLR